MPDLQTQSRAQPHYGTDAQQPVDVRLQMIFKAYEKLRLEGTIPTDLYPSKRETRARQIDRWTYPSSRHPDAPVYLTMPQKHVENARGRPIEESVHIIRLLKPFEPPGEQEPVREECQKTQSQHSIPLRSQAQAPEQYFNTPAPHREPVQSRLQKIFTPTGSAPPIQESETPRPSCWFGGEMLLRVLGYVLPSHPAYGSCCLGSWNPAEPTFTNTPANGHSISNPNTLVSIGPIGGNSPMLYPQVELHPPKPKARFSADPPKPLRRRVRFSSPEVTMTWPSKPHSIPPLKDPRPIESIAKLFRVELSAKGVGLYEIPAVHGIEKPVAGVEVAKINSELSIKDGSSPKIKLVVSREPALKENDAADLDGAWYLFEGATLATLLPNKYPTKAPRKQPICEPPSLSTLCDRGLQALSLKMAELETYTLENPLELPPKEEEGILRDGIREEDEETFKGVELVKVVFEDGGVGVFVDSGTCLTESR